MTKLLSPIGYLVAQVSKTDET